MSASKLDAMYRSFLLTKFFTKGWGKPENLRRLFEFRKVVSNRDECFKLIERDYPVTITKEQNLSDCKLLEGYFVTPLERYLPGIVPEEAQKAYFQALLPIHWPAPDVKPVCLHLAGTGDHFFWRRRNLMVKPLLKEAGIGGIILENPFYGLRKPTDQVRSSLHNVSDIFVMGGCLILEALVLFHWCERLGLGPLGVTGLSMGGHMASLAATNWPKPLVLVPCLSWSTASAVFLEGVMSHSINWDLLEDQYLSDGIYREKLSKMVTIVDEAFLAGKKFARTYSQTMETDSKAHTPLVNSIDATLATVTPKEPTDSKIDGSLKNNSSTSGKETTNSKLDDVSFKYNSIVDMLKNLIDTANAKGDSCNSSYATDQLHNLQEDLKKLLAETMITQELYSKLTSNEKFELDAEDIDCINKLNANQQLKDILLRCKVAEIKTDLQTHTQQKKTESLQETDPHTAPSSALSKPKPEPIVSVVPADKKVKTRKWHVSDFTSDIWLNLPFMRSSGKKIDIGKIHWRDREALQFMRGIMDECTHLSNFSIPYDTSLIIAVCAKHDAYVPRADVGTLEEIWPGAEVRYVDAGHVSAYILHQSLFRSCIKEAFERSKNKWVNGKHIE